MKDEIERALQPILGQPLSDMVCSKRSQLFEFGVQRPYKDYKGQDITWADWMLNVACSWRIAGPDGSIVSSDNFRSERDLAAHSFYSIVRDASLKVTAIVADEHGGFCMRLTDGYRMEVQCDVENEEPSQEQ